MGNNSFIISSLQNFFTFCNIASIASPNTLVENGDCLFFAFCVYAQAVYPQKLHVTIIIK